MTSISFNDWPWHGEKNKSEQSAPAPILHGSPYSHIQPPHPGLRILASGGRVTSSTSKEPRLGRFGRWSGTLKFSKRGVLDVLTRDPERSRSRKASTGSLNPHPASNRSKRFKPCGIWKLKVLPSKSSARNPILGQICCPSTRNHINRRYCTIARWNWYLQKIELLHTFSILFHCCSSCRSFYDVILGFQTFANREQSLQSRGFHAWTSASLYGKTGKCWDAHAPPKAASKRRVEPPNFQITFGHLLFGDIWHL